MSHLLVEIITLLAAVVGNVPLFDLLREAAVRGKLLQLLQLLLGHRVEILPVSGGDGNYQVLKIKVIQCSCTKFYF